ncbi:hypothetical protein FOZ76_07680 [Verticiella sediminum]|uniref:Uncharacterized protein n=1 Tax=Verticiella sediminum TaxID=1247510 RepID=A0A556AVD0_9BURK|nr:hypothetical protein [Verticiella sediminum]TSH96903.1 hypothetical protein FOZ76_07680 [Verticiella sediminum]
MRQKTFTVPGAGIRCTAKLEGETARTVLITRDDHPQTPLLTLDPVDHELAHVLQDLPDDEFLELAITRALDDGLLRKALDSGGPVVALLRP